MEATPGMDDYDRLAELNRQANDYIERSQRAAASGSPVGTREWLDAAESALRAAGHVREAITSRQRS